jgi:hypothetical protein
MVHEVMVRQLQDESMLNSGLFAVDHFISQLNDLLLNRLLPGKVQLTSSPSPSALSVIVGAGTFCTTAQPA